MLNVNLFVLTALKLKSPGLDAGNLSFPELENDLNIHSFTAAAIHLT